jgi:hypothetical protein
MGNWRPNVMSKFRPPVFQVHLVRNRCWKGEKSYLSARFFLRRFAALVNPLRPSKFISIDSI